MADINLRLEVRVSQRVLRLGMTAAMLLAAAGDLASESVQLTTYYPAPSGVYTQLIGTSNTWLSRDAGMTTIGDAASEAAANTKLLVLGQTGIGTSSPGAQLTVTNYDSGTENIVQVYPSNLTQGVGIAYNHISEIGTNGNNALSIDAQGAGQLNLQTVASGQTYVGNGLTTKGVALGAFGGSAEIYANGDDHTGGGILISNDGGFFDYNNGWTTYNGSYGLMVAGNNGASSTNGTLYVQGGSMESTVACSIVPYGAGVSNCGGGQYATVISGVYSVYSTLGNTPGQDNNTGVGTGEMLCCPCPIYGCNL